MTIDRCYIPTNRTNLVIEGDGFGSTQGTVQLTDRTPTQDLKIVSWGNKSITAQTAGVSHGTVQVTSSNNQVATGTF